MELNIPITSQIVRIIEKNFTNCMYEGTVYRLMVLKNREQITKDDNYYSFSKDANICHCIVYGINSGFRKYILIKQFCRGIDLIKLCRELLKEDISDLQKKRLKHLINAYQYEKEVLCKMDNFEIVAQEGYNITSKNRVKTK